MVSFDTVDAMRVQDGKITDHCGVASLYSAVPQLRGRNREVAVHPLAKEHEPDRRGCWQKRPDGMPYEEG